MLLITFLVTTFVSFVVKFVTTLAFFQKKKHITKKRKKKRISVIKKFIILNIS